MHSHTKCTGKTFSIVCNMDFVNRRALDFHRSQISLSFQWLVTPSHSTPLILSNQSAMPRKGISRSLSTHNMSVIGFWYQPVTMQTQVAIQDDIRCQQLAAIALSDLLLVGLSLRDRGFVDGSGRKGRGWGACWLFSLHGHLHLLHELRSQRQAVLPFLHTHAWNSGSIINSITSLNTEMKRNACANDKNLWRMKTA
jgi:hypothetical protein